MMMGVALVTHRAVETLSKRLRQDCISRLEGACTLVKRLRKIRRALILKVEVASIYRRGLNLSVQGAYNLQSISALLRNGVWPGRTSIERLKSGL